MKSQSGFGIITVIVILVLLAALAGGLVALGTAQSTTVSQDVLSARADQTARAGVQWGLFQAFSGTSVWGGASCDSPAPSFAAPVSTTISLAAVTGFQVTVSCGSALYGEGETGNPSPNNKRTVRVYRITAIACPAVPATTCPRNDATTATATYVERRREAIGL